jgi:hypothetical protein
MSNVYLLNASENLVTLGNVFSTERSYLYKNIDQFTNSASYSFTKTLLSADLRVYRETAKGISLTKYSDIQTRENLGEDIPTKGPFIENYSVNGLLDINSFVNLLLVDKPPVRTGFFDFFIGGYTFSGFITKLDQYIHYNWQEVAGKYNYVEQPTSLGYGIEISKNSLYRSELQSNGTYIIFPTELNIFLQNLNGNEEIISTSSVANPNSYLNTIPGRPGDTADSLPISLFYISTADALRYIASHSDLILSLGADPVAGQIHYANQRAGRTITFDPIAYLNKYSDIRSLYGYDTYNATIHYITTGYSQGRTLTEASAENSLEGGLYDERAGAITLTDTNIIWPLGETLVGRGASLTYKYNIKNYFFNSALNVNSNLLYLGVQ